MDRLREQRKLYEQAKQMFENIKVRKNLLEEIERKTCDYEKNLRNFNVRELMFRYQYINQYNDEKSKLEVRWQNNQIQLKDLEQKKKMRQKNFLK